MNYVVKAGSREETGSPLSLSGHVSVAFDATGAVGRTGTDHGAAQSVPSAPRLYGRPGKSGRAPLDLPFICAREGEDVGQSEDVTGASP